MTLHDSPSFNENPRITHDGAPFLPRDESLYIPKVTCPSCDRQMRPSELNADGRSIRFDCHTETCGRWPIYWVQFR